MAPLATLTIEGHVTNVAVARAFAVRLADLVSPSGRMQERSEVDKLALLVSELVTNAVEHGEGPVQVSLTGDEECLRVEIVDQGSSLPAPRFAMPGALSGRGLEIVEKLARSWGWEPIPGGGKTVWFEY